MNVSRNTMLTRVEQCSTLYNLFQVPFLFIVALLGLGYLTLVSNFWLFTISGNCLLLYSQGSALLPFLLGQTSGLTALAELHGLQA